MEFIMVYKDIDTQETELSTSQNVYIYHYKASGYLNTKY